MLLFESNRKLNKINSTYFQLRRGIEMGVACDKSSQFIDGKFDLSGTNLMAVEDQSSNCSSKMNLNDKTTWPPEAQNCTKST